MWRFPRMPSSMCLSSMKTTDMREIGIYIHVPFCIRKCLYCDFLSFPADIRTKRLYVEALEKEMAYYGPAMQDCTVTSIFIGGGTPSTMPAESLYAIMHSLKMHFHIAEDAEITMEMNPGTVTEEIASFAAEELTRVSLGAQSFSDRELRSLGRIHSSRDIVRSLDLLREKGIRNINLDLMSGLPHQTEETWERSLQSAVALDIPHISAYSLIIEEGTPFHDLMRKGMLSLPDENVERTMYHRTGELLAEAGYIRYEISNYAKAGYACRHNSKYWRRTEYLGMGPGASSFFDHRRWTNTRDMNAYIEGAGAPHGIREDGETLTRQEEMEEFMFLGLRMMSGISSQTFKDDFGKSIEDVYGPVLRKHIEEGVLKKEGGRYALTERGIDVSNIVLADYLLS